MLSKLLLLFKTTSFLILLCSTLVMTSISLGVWAISLSKQVATLSASAASMAIKHRKEIKKAVAKTKAKARFRYMTAAIPFVGLAAAATYEKRDFDQWQAEHPKKDFGDYTCEMGATYAELTDEVLQDISNLETPFSYKISEFEIPFLNSLPDMEIPVDFTLPSPDYILSALPKCEP